MSSRESTAEQIFAEALERDVAARQAFVQDECAADPLLLGRVEALLRAHGEPNSLLDGERLVATLKRPAADNVGQQIGPYKLREVLGEGGMGSVFVAEQEEPVRRKVALKIIKPGMDSRQVLARFDAERRALALMDHPNVARVLDAGTTESGRPYFVMELVRGVPITEFCDQRRLGPRERLEIFVQVCRAIQHAHQNGIIHRDVKPTNVLVTLHDELAVPKVIDFGIAKATGQRLTEQTVYTAFNQMIGTPLYMSPEQAEMNALDVDTRSDVYSLGVLLYELLTGATPFDGDALRQAGFDEMRRLIREVDPPRPSQRVTTLAAHAASTVSQRRGVDERRLARVLRGDLDWIVMKALEKDRNRRYESASALAADVQRYLNGEPIQAKKPRLFVGARKWSRRHPTATTAGAVAAILLLMVATGMAADRHRQVRAASSFVQASLQAANEALAADDVGQALQRLTEARTRMEADEVTDQALVERTATQLGETERYAEFVQLFRKARTARSAEPGNVAHAEKALELYRVMKEPQWLDALATDYLPETHMDRVTEAVYELLLLKADHLTRWQGSEPESARLAGQEIRRREAVAHLEKAKSFHAPSRGYYWLLANCAQIAGDNEEAKRLRTAALESAPHDAAELFYINRDRLWGPVAQDERYPFEENLKDHREMLRLDPAYYNGMFFMALRLSEEERYAEALVGWYGCLALKPRDSAALLNRGWAHSHLGHYEEAKADYEAVLAAAPNVPQLLAEVALNLATGPSEEIRDGQRAVELAEQACKLTDYEDAMLLSTLACACAEAGDFASAVKWSETAVELSGGSLRREYARRLENFRQGKPWRRQ